VVAPCASKNEVSVGPVSNVSQRRAPDPLNRSVIVPPEATSVEFEPPTETTAVSAKPTG